MRRPPNPKLMADLATLLGTYDPEELREGLRMLADPTALAALARLVEKAVDAGIHRQASRRGKAEEQPRELEGDRIARIKVKRAEDAAVIDEVLAAGKTPWSKARVERLRDLTHRYNQRSITGKAGPQRRSQLMALVERAPRELLEAMAEEFRGSGQEGATLEDWSKIILRNRKPKP